MSTSASAAFSISYITPDGLAAFPFFILLIDSLTMSLSIKRGITVFTVNFSKLFSYLHD